MHLNTGSVYSSNKCNSISYIKYKIWEKREKAPHDTHTHISFIMSLGVAPCLLLGPSILNQAASQPAIQQQCHCWYSPFCSINEETCFNIFTHLTYKIFDTKLIARATEQILKHIFIYHFCPLSIDFTQRKM